MFIEWDNGAKAWLVELEVGKLYKLKRLNEIVGDDDFIINTVPSDPETTNGEVPSS